MGAQSTLKHEKETSSARIGPNALIQTVKSLQSHCNSDSVNQILAKSQLEELLTHEPEKMVAEADVARLYQALSSHLGHQQGYRVLHQSGERTAGYLLENRIPKPFQALLKILPRRAALRLLLFAIQQNAWTFVGSGTFAYKVAQQPRITVTTPLRPQQTVSGYYAATFETLIHVLIDAQAELLSDITSDSGSTHCVYIVHFS